MNHDSQRLIISVITATLNAQETIERAIHSVRDQTYSDTEYLVIDGGSTDDTVDIIKRSQNCINFFLSEPDNGIYSAMNKGIRHSNGDVLFFLNADDYFADSRVLIDVATVFTGNPGIELVYGNQIFDYGDRQSLKKQSFKITRKQLARMTIQHQTIFARKQLFEETNGFSEKYTIVSDYEWILKAFLVQNCRYLYIDRNISIMSTSGLSWTSDLEKERITAMKDFFTPMEIFEWRILPQRLRKISDLMKKMIVL